MCATLRVFSSLLACTCGTGAGKGLRAPGGSPWGPDCSGAALLQAGFAPRRAGPYFNTPTEGEPWQGRSV